MVLHNSNSNWPFLDLNLYFIKGTLRLNSTKPVNKFQYPGTEKGLSAMESIREVLGLGWVCLGVEVGF